MSENQSSSTSTLRSFRIKRLRSRSEGETPILGNFNNFEDNISSGFSGSNISLASNSEDDVFLPAGKENQKETASKARAFGSGTAVHEQAQEIVINVYEYLKGKVVPPNRVWSETSTATGLSLSAVKRIINEGKIRRTFLKCNLL